MVEQTRRADLGSLERDVTLAKVARTTAYLALQEHDTRENYVAYIRAASAYQVALKKFTSAKRMGKDDT